MAVIFTVVAFDKLDSPSRCCAVSPAAVDHGLYRYRSSVVLFDTDSDSLGWRYGTRQTPPVVGLCLSATRALLA
jgi:hypothetical protein